MRVDGGDLSRLGHEAIFWSAPQKTKRKASEEAFDAVLEEAPKKFPPAPSHPETFGRRANCLQRRRSGER